jgi:hypothetical protein
MRVTAETLTEQLQLADDLWAGRDTMLEPQDLPGRWGRVVKAIDHLLNVVNCPAVVGGGWAVWRHGYVGRVTQDIDVVLPADRIDDFLRTAAVAGFDVLPTAPGLLHRETGIKIDILPEGQRPGTTQKPAPTPLPHPSQLGGIGHALRYITLPALIALKLGAGRARDEADIIELVRANPEQIGIIRQHLESLHGDYVTAFDALAQRAREQRDQ